MAQDLEDGEFWLPSDFLKDDDLLTDFKTDLLKTNGSNDFPHGFGGSSASNSDLSSPVDSVMSSMETESDEDDFVVGLTRKIARTTFQDSNLFSDCKPHECWKPSTSPQSTLCACKQESRPTSMASPPEAQDAGWDMLYTDAEEVSRMRIIEETTPFHPTKLFAPPPKPIHVAVPAGKPTPNMGFHPTQAQSQARRAYLRLQATHFQQMQMQMQQIIKKGVWGQVPQYHNGKMTGETRRTRDLSMEAWPTLEQSRQQQQSGSGMRAVFLGKNGVRKERTGTGVFLPRTYNPTETRKKSGYSTVLLPDSNPGLELEYLHG